VSATLQVGKVVLFRDPAPAAPKLQVEWSSRWREFIESIKPALGRSEARLAGEAPFGLIPLRIMVPSYFVEAFVIFAAVAIQVKVAELRPHVVPRFSQHDVIYYSGDELPRTEDLGGAEAGTSGRAGGEEAYHRSQTIKVARGKSQVSKMVDAPDVRLPASTDAVANLLAVRPDPGPPPAEGLRSSRSAMNLATTIVSPAPNVIRDYTRNGVELNSIIAPAPSVARDRSLTAPTLNPTLIAPAPNVANDHVLVAPALAPAVIAPAPSVARDRTPASHSLDAQVIAPAPKLSADPGRSAPVMAGNVIPPAPVAVQRDPFKAPLQMTTANVVPPPVSAPERANARTSAVTLPAPSVVAPPPSADLSQETRRFPGGTATDPARGVVPPPPSQPASGSLISSMIGRIFGASEVVPPPPSVNNARSSGTAPSMGTNVVPPPPSATAAGARAAGGGSLAPNVVAPPPSTNANATGGNPRGTRTGAGAKLDPNVVSPPPSVGVTGGTGASNRWTAPNMGSPNVVPPPPVLSGPGGGTGDTPGGKGIQGGTLLANNVVPPAPSVGGISGEAGSGSGRKGAGLGAPTDVGMNLAPEKTGGSGPSAGAVMSTQPGTKVGIPTNAGTGSLAMSPSGGEKTGVGGAGGGTGTAHGNGSGSGMTGSGAGAARGGAGHGADLNARGGISMASGPGGAGNGAAGNPAVRGIDISGGSSIITLPGFGSDPAASDPASSASKRTSLKPQQELNVTVVATATSGGAFEPYKKLLRGEKYTTYINTSLGTVVMEFADNAPIGHSFAGSITAPAALRADIPADTPQGRMVVIGTLDAAGNLKGIRVLEAGSAQMTAKIVAALRSWKFQPAMRNDQPVQVTAILGFGINTDDRF
jgi:TonB family protein